MKISTQVSILVTALLPLGSVYAEPQFPVVSLTAGMYVIQAEVAATEAQRQQGLMFSLHVDEKHPGAAIGRLY
jgi:hypothetical protein